MFSFLYVFILFHSSLFLLFFFFFSGAYQVRITTPKRYKNRHKNSAANNLHGRTSSTVRTKTTTQCVVVMGNVFYGACMNGMEVFDLKGKMRFCSRETLLEQTLMEQHRKKTLRNQWKLWRSGPRLNPPPANMNEQRITPVRYDGDLMALTRGLPVPLKERDMEHLKDRVCSDGDFFLGEWVVVGGCGLVGWWVGGCTDSLFFF
jgi:hypothetical protein